MQEQDKKCIFVTGGGTGGHIYPAVAVCDALIEDNTYDIYYVGNPNNMEFSIVNEKGIKFLPVKVKGMPRKVEVSLLLWSLQLTVAIFQSLFYLMKYKPKAVFGTGGYVSAPTLIACACFKFLNIPFMMHDCDAQPGLVTRKMASYAAKISLAFESAKKFITNENTFVFGNPIRKTFKELSKSEARKNLSLENKLTVCIMGGSQGAQTINNSAVEILKKLSANDVQVIFQTGKKNFDKTIEKLLKVYPKYEYDKNLIVRPYFSDMVTVLKSSDIVVSRAGSLSLSEICAVPAASILIPYPHAAADHQRKNARFLQEKNASIYLEDSDLNEEILLNDILSLVNNKEQLLTLKQNALKLANYDATENIVSELLNIVKKD